MSKRPRHGPTNLVIDHCLPAKVYWVASMPDHLINARQERRPRLGGPVRKARCFDIGASLLTIVRSGASLLPETIVGNAMPSWSEPTAGRRSGRQEELSNLWAPPNAFVSRNPKPTPCP
ncbi:unnamed protein product [Ectocarpus fasciculatus]